jgi:hypothetical protein
MASTQLDSVRKGPLARLRAIARAIVSATAEEEMRLRRQDLLKLIARDNNARAADGATRGSHD